MKQATLDIQAVWLEISREVVRFWYCENMYVSVIEICVNNIIVV